MPKTVVVFTDGVPVPLSLQYMHDRAWWSNEAGVWTTVNHAILTTWLGHACWPLSLSVLTFIEISCVRGRSCRLSVLYSPKGLHTKEFRLPFHRLQFLIRSVMNVEATLHERVYLTANPKWKLKTQPWRYEYLNDTTKYAAFYGHFDTSSARTNVTRVSATNNSIATSLIRHLLR
jgi:hypothetical protein